MADLATAYVRLVPSLKGAQKAIGDELGGVDTKGAGKKLGDGLGNNLKANFKAAAPALGKALAVGIAAGLVAGAAAITSAVVSITKQAFNSYADYEQLVGGVEKLYGDSAQKMIDYANQAYMTMGKSKNDYMQQVTSFSAALISDMGGDTAAAADMANVAMTAIADNVSIFGSNVEDVQNAYQGFAKQNYTMLDNLKLGYGGTREEMQRLIADANEYAASIGQASDLSIESFADIVTAIDLIQQKQGIAGNAAAESLKTISGSIAATKAAYDNLLTTLGDPNGDISAAVTNLVDMVSNSASLIIPKVTEIMTNLAVAIPQLVDQMLPVLEEHATELIEAISEVIAALTPVLLEAALILLAALVAAVAKATPKILASMGELVLKLISEIANGIAPAMDEMNNFMQGILDSIGSFFGSLWNAGVQLVNEIISGAGQVGNDMAYYFGLWIDNAVQAVQNFFWSMYNAGVELVNGLVQGISDNFWAVVNTVTGGIQNAIDSAKAALGIASPSKVFAEMGAYTMQGLANGIEKASGEAERAMNAAMLDVYGAASGSASMSIDANANADGFMVSEIASLREELRQMRLVLNVDGRAFAEATVNEIDRALATMNRRAVAR